MGGGCKVSLSVQSPTPSFFFKKWSLCIEADDRDHLAATCRASLTLFTEWPLQLQWGSARVFPAFVIWKATKTRFQADCILIRALSPVPFVEGHSGLRSCFQVADSRSCPLAKVTLGIPLPKTRPIFIVLQAVSGRDVQIPSTGH